MSRTTAAIVTILVVAASTIAGRAADDIPDSATIRARIAAATGVDHTAWHETYASTFSNGTTMIEQVAHRGRDVRVRLDYGPFHTESGSYKGQDWHQNDNGQTILDQPDPEAPIPEVTTTRVTHVHAPIDAYVVATLDRRAYGQRDYIDPATWHVVRRETLRPTGTITTVYDDFRPDHGRTFAHHWHVQNGSAGTTEDTRVTAYDDGPVADDEVATAPPRRALVTFPVGAETVTLPTQFGRSHIYVRVTINGRGLDFVLDSGASGITLDSTVAKQLGLPLYNTRKATTAGRYATARTVVPEMHVGDLVMRDVAVQVVPQGWETGEGVKEVGLLGFDFLAELGVTIDYEHQRVTVVRGRDYTAPNDPHTASLDVRIGRGQPLATVTINGASGNRWVLDTGGSGTFLIFDYFARRHPGALRDEGAGSRSLTQYLYGIGGEFEVKPYQIADLELANLRFKDFVGYRVVPKASYSANEDGVIGTTFLRYFTLGLDYGNSRVYLTPNREGRAAFGIR
jgi:clan AA aspartic protease (TIGR02281 family)